MNRSRAPFPVSPWLMLPLATLPLAAMMLFATDAGRLALRGLYDPTEAMLLFPGLTVEDAQPPLRGLVITSLRSDSEAVTNGIAVGDSLSAIDGRPIGNLDQAIDYLHQDSRPTIVLQVVHNHAARRVMLVRQRDGAHGT